MQENRKTNEVLLRDEEFVG